MFLSRSTLKINPFRNIMLSNNNQNQLYITSKKLFFYNKNTEESKAQNELKGFEEIKRFLLDRETYNWDDYHQQILVNINL